MDSVVLENIGKLVGTIGFPGLIAIILLRTILGSFNQRLETLDRRLNQLNNSIVLVTKTLTQLSKEDSTKLNTIFTPVVEHSNNQTNN
ncbi:hypothetical protein [Cohnella phaseoli]|uniref:YvrJ-like protein n=1 Tax=Cohnella phaseoli TaxID=456490 RepID=A0A3D9I188_9BACL|nr:hypothetical protein [Cohnella phaseoli]RED55431.1 hypothetical protein DFP98_14377 [Cohnella phaseoli]